MSPANTGRSNAALFALRSHQWAKGDAITDNDTSVIDLLTDLRHYCDARGFDFAELDGIASAHHLLDV